MMALVATTAAVKTFSVCSTALFVKVFATTMIQGGKAFAAGSRPPEDNRFDSKTSHHPAQRFGLQKDQEQDQAIQIARETDIRWRRIVQNDLESIPIGLAVFLGSVLVGGHETVNVALMSAFTASRFGHTYAYARHLQPHRSILWTTGQLSVIASGLNGVAAVVI